MRSLKKTSQGIQNLAEKMNEIAMSTEYLTDSFNLFWLDDTDWLKDYNTQHRAKIRSQRNNGHYKVRTHTGSLRRL